MMSVLLDSALYVNRSERFTTSNEVSAKDDASFSALCLLCELFFTEFGYVSPSRTAGASVRERVEAARRIYEKYEQSTPKRFKQLLHAAVGAINAYNSTAQVKDAQLSVT